MIKNDEKVYVPKEALAKPLSRSYLLLLKFIDILISSTIIAPCVIGYWRGTWGIIEILMMPEDVNRSSLISFVVGSFGHIFFTMCQDSFKKSFDPDKRRLTYYIASRCYTAIFGIICVNMWRGVWNLCDCLTSKTSLIVVVVTTLLAVVALVVTRTTRNLGAAPFVVCIDQRSIYFEITTIFNTQKYRRPVLYFLDTFFSAIVVGTLVVVAWRGVWVIFDITFYKDDEHQSAVGSLIIGYGIVVISFALQPLLQRVCTHVSGASKLVLADTYYLISFVGAVNVWRGLWVLLDLYLYPDNLLKSCFVSHAIAFVVLTVLNCANSILVRGIAIDGEEIDNSSCVDFPIAYVKLHFRNQRTRKYIEKSRNNEDRRLEEQKLTQT